MLFFPGTRDDEGRALLSKIFVPQCGQNRTSFLSSLPQFEHLIPTACGLWK
jgi:hypothetical protein